MRLVRLRAALLAAALAAVCGTPSWPPAAEAGPRPADPPNVLLLTLDTTRADALGAFGGRAARTPVLDALAARGTRWDQAIASTPMTQPAHASLFTGLAPPEHGVEDNGSAVLPRGLPTLAEAFAARGYATAAFVAAPILDRRFGLDRGFQHYDDRIPGEEIPGRHTPERDARQMTGAALEWLGRRPTGKPVFLWVHYFDPHQPYRPADVPPAASARQRYAGEVAAMDREIGRLLAALPGGAERWLIAAVGDHGESLGEHGEPTHSLFLYHATLHVPLILAGPRVPPGQAVREAVAARRLASTLLRLTSPGGAAVPGAPLPGLPGLASGAPSPVYLASRYAQSAYGWSPLEGIFDGRFKLIVAPRPELYDLAADPGEIRNLLPEGTSEQRQTARRLRQELAAARRAFRIHPGEAAGPELADALRGLGYLSGSGGKSALDPKDGILLLAEMDAALELAQRKSWQPALARLTELVRRSPGTSAFLNALAMAQLASGDGGAAIATYRRAVEVAPRSGYLHLQLADACAHEGRREDARQGYELALALSPRSIPAWWGLVLLAERAGNPAEARAILNRAVAAGTESPSLLKRLAKIEAAAGDTAAAERHLAAARRLAGR